MMIIFWCKFPLLLFHKKLAGLSLPPVLFSLSLCIIISLFLFFCESLLKYPFFCRMKIMTPFPIGLKSPKVICSDIGLWKGVGRKSCHGGICNKPLGPMDLGIQIWKGPLFCSCETCKLAFENWKSNWWRITFIFMKFEGKKIYKI